MYRAIITETKDETEYDITANFIGIIEELNENFVFDESELLCGFLCRNTYYVFGYCKADGKWLPCSRIGRKQI